MHISTTIVSRISHIFQPNSGEERDFFAFKKKSLPVLVHFKVHQLASSPWWRCMALSMSRINIK